MQVTNSLGGGGQPAFSQEMIAEFQFISNRFDATQGRSQGVQVNVVTKSGTNQLAGSFRANFRDDRFNAEIQRLDRKVPISNQQFAGSVGGPILRDRLHYFGFYEYEREPRTSIWNTPYPRFNVELQGNVPKKLGGAQSRLSDLAADAPDARRGISRRRSSPSVPAATTTIRPTRRPRERPRTPLQAQLTQVLSNRH